MTSKLGLMLLMAPALSGQSALPKWQEFSIGAATKNRSQFTANGIRSEGCPLRRAISKAYGVSESRIAGPDWIATERYALTAIVADPKDFQPLLQQELANQFHMLVHRETKVVPVYVLKPVEGAAKPAAAITEIGAKGYNGINLPHSTVAAFADLLADAVARPIVDETRMEGRFDFILSWKSLDNVALMEALKDQLGLHLSDERRPVDLLMIDHIEKLQFAK